MSGIVEKEAVAHQQPVATHTITGNEKHSNDSTPVENYDHDRDLESKSNTDLDNSDVDLAARFVDANRAHSVSPEAERRVLRRVDLFLIPVLFVTFAFQYMDKACLTGAAIFGILGDLKLTSVDFVNGKAVPNTLKYSYASLIFYWGYLLGLIPGVYLSQRLPLGKYVATVVFLWGGVTVCTVAVNNYPGLMVQRFFLGFSEAGIAPAFSLITAMWYRSNEQPMRYAIWYSAVGMGTLVGTLVLYAIGQIKGELSPWRYQFMIIGSASCVWGIAVWFLLPDSPMTAYFLNPEQRIIAVERMRYEQTGIENKTVKSAQIKEAFSDPKTWFFIAITFLANFTNGAVTGFGSIIVSSFGYDPLRTILLLGGAGAWVFVFLITAGTISVFIPNQRANMAIFCALPPIAGAVMVWQSGPWGRNSPKAQPLWGFYMLSTFSTTYVMILSLMSANTAGHTKKAVTAGLVWISYSISNGIAPITVLTQEKDEHYPTAFKLIIAFMSATFVLLVLLRFYLMRHNKKRDAVKLVSREESARTAFLDMTDMKNQNFRYHY